MGRPYLPCTHSLGRALGYPGGAVPEAVTCLLGYPRDPPFAPPMFDPSGIVLYFKEIINTGVPDSGPLLRYARRWDTGETWCYVPSLGIDVPGSGLVEYIIQSWPDNLLPATDPPKPAAIRHYVQWYWDFAAAFPWTYQKYDSTLLGMISRVGWEMPMYSLGFASPPCSVSPWLFGWSSQDWGPATWSQVSEQSFYDPLDVWTP